MTSPTKILLRNGYIGCVDTPLNIKIVWNLKIFNHWYVKWTMSPEMIPKASNFFSVVSIISLEISMKREVGVKCISRLLFV